MLAHHLIEALWVVPDFSFQYDTACQHVPMEGSLGLLHVPRRLICGRQAKVCDAADDTTAHTARGTASYVNRAPGNVK
ncbi:MAG: hypothetical protein ACRD6W_03645 [Nitrososphaerales archaeon]